MKYVVAAAVLIGSLSFFGAQPAAAGERWQLLSPRERHAYHACMFESWIQDYCHWHAWIGRYPQCVLANRGSGYPTAGYWFSEDYCYRAAQGLLTP
jgi:hypothetical protein